MIDPEPFVSYHMFKSHLPNNPANDSVYIYCRVAHFLFIPCLLVLSSAYSGSLISYLSIDVFPPPPQTYDQVAKEVIKKDLKVALCCKEIEDVFRESELESFQEFYKRVSLYSIYIYQ